MKVQLEIYSAIRGLYARASGVVLGAVAAAVLVAFTLTVVMPGLLAACASAFGLCLFFAGLLRYLAFYDAKCRSQGMAQWSVAFNGFVVGTIPDHVVSALRAQAACELHLYVLQVSHYLRMTVKTIRVTFSVVIQGAVLSGLAAAAFAPESLVQFGNHLFIRTSAEWQVVLPQMVGFLAVGIICAFCVLVTLGFHEFTDYDAFATAVGDRALRHLGFSGKGAATIEQCAEYIPRAPGSQRTQVQR